MPKNYHDEARKEYKLCVTHGDMVEWIERALQAEAQLKAGLELNFIGTPKTALGHAVKEWVKGTIALLKELEGKQ